MQRELKLDILTKSYQIQIWKCNTKYNAAWLIASGVFYECPLSCIVLNGKLLKMNKV